VATPALASGAGRSAGRFPDGNDTDANCADFITSGPTPGAENLFALDPGRWVSLRTSAGADFIKHNDYDDLVVTAPVTTSSSATDKRDATWVQAASLADPSCVSFESVNKPGSYLRHANLQLHLQPNDGSAVFAGRDVLPAAGQQRSGHVVPVGQLPGPLHPHLQRHGLTCRQRRRQPMGHRHLMGGRLELDGGRAVGAGAMTPM
jgi:hypothetical protein